MISLVSAPVGLIAVFLPMYILKRREGWIYLNMQVPWSNMVEMPFFYPEIAQSTYFFDVGRYNDRVDGCDLSCDQSG